MITIEMMISKIEEGMEKIKAATFAFTSTAFPMLTGTLITILGFLPIGFADNNTGQYYVLAVCRDRGGARRLLVRRRHLRAGDRAVAPAVAHEEGARDRRAGPLHARFRTACSASPCGIAGSPSPQQSLPSAPPLYGMGFVQQQFFPASNRPELLVTMSLPKNASIAATEAQTERLEKALAGDPDIARFSSYVGGGAIRFYLPLDVQLDNDFMAETVVVAKDLEARDRVAGPAGGAVRRQLSGRDRAHLAS